MILGSKIEKVLTVLIDERRAPCKNDSKILTDQFEGIISIALIGSKRDACLFSNSRAGIRYSSLFGPLQHKHTMLHKRERNKLM